MKTLLIILFLIPSVCFSQVDKALHVGYGYLTGSSAYFMSNSIKDVSNTGAIIISASTVTFIAAGKEMIDGKPDVKDFFATELGGAMGITATYFVTKQYFKRHSFFFDTRTISDKRFTYLGYRKTF